MQGLNPLVILSKGLDSLDLSLGQPPDPSTLKTPDERKEAYIHWAITYYVYSVIAHIRTVLRGLIALADSGNIPTAMVVCRHVFEWAAQVCYMNENLGKPAIYSTKRSSAANGLKSMVTNTTPSGGRNPEHD